MKFKYLLLLIVAKFVFIACENDEDDDDAGPYYGRKDRKAVNIFCKTQNVTVLEQRHIIKRLACMDEDQILDGIFEVWDQLLGINISQMTPLDRIRTACHNHSFIVSPENVTSTTRYGQRFLYHLQGEEIKSLDKNMVSLWLPPLDMFDNYTACVQMSKYCAKEYYDFVDEEQAYRSRDDDGNIEEVIFNGFENPECVPFTELKGHLPNQTIESLCVHNASGIRGSMHDSWIRRHLCNVHWRESYAIKTEAFRCNRKFNRATEDNFESVLHNIADEENRKYGLMTLQRRINCNHFPDEEFEFSEICKYSDDKDSKEYRKLKKYFGKNQFDVDQLSTFCKTNMTSHGELNDLSGGRILMVVDKILELKCPNEEAVETALKCLAVQRALVSDHNSVIKFTGSGSDF